MAYRIEDIDRNFAPANICGCDVIFCDVKSDPFEIYGLFDAKAPNEPFCRMPKLEAVGNGVDQLRMNTAGGKVRFKTDSPYIAIRAQIEDACLMSHMALAGSCGFDLYTVEKNEEIFFRAMMPTTGICYGEKSFQCFLNLYNGDEKALSLYFPLYNGIKRLEIGIKPGSFIDSGAPFACDKPIVYYGSSITQGGCASRPGNAYPALITHKTNIDHLNLGFSGSCVAEPQMAKYISSLSMCAFVYDYDYNAPSAEYLKETHEPFFKMIRKAHPDLPVIMLSAPFCAKEKDDRTRRDIIRSTYENAIASGDKNVYFIDGGKIFDGEFSDACSVDGVHPNDLGFARIASKLLPVLKKALGI